MEPIRSIAELPFRPRGILDLLHLDAHRDEPDPEYAGYGHARVDAIALACRGDGAPPRLVRDALVIAVHSADDPEALADDIELEFLVPEVGDGYSVTVQLSDFLRIWLPQLHAPLPGEAARPVVLVVCNPHRARISLPASARGIPIHYPLGDVESWLHLEDGRGALRLVADAWRITEPATATEDDHG